MSGATRLNYGGSVTAIAEVIGEDHTGNSGAVVTLDSGYSAGTTRVYFNGVRLNDGGANDYEETDPSLGTITLLGTWEDPGPSDVILVDYMTYAGITDAAYFPYVSSDVATGSLIYRYGAESYRYVGLAPGASGEVLTISASGTPAWESMGLSDVLSRGNSFGSYPGSAAGGFFQSSGISFTLGGSSTVFGNGGMGRYAGPSSFYPSTDLVFQTPSTSGKIVTVPNRTGTLVLDTEIASTYLPLSGGTVSGEVFLQHNTYPATTWALLNLTPAASSMNTSPAIWFGTKPGVTLSATGGGAEPADVFGKIFSLKDWGLVFGTGEYQTADLDTPLYAMLDMNSGTFHVMSLNLSTFDSSGVPSEMNSITQGGGYVIVSGGIVSPWVESYGWVKPGTVPVSGYVSGGIGIASDGARPVENFSLWFGKNATTLEQVAFQSDLEAYVNGASDSTLLTSGTGPYGLGIDLSNPNVWTGAQTFVSVQASTYFSSTGSSGLTDTFTLGGSSFVIENGLIVSRS